MLSKNDIINLTITSASADGSGIGRTDEGMAVFVPLSAIGDELAVRILKVKNTYAYAKIESLLIPSPLRITPDCDCYSRCGGCVWRHISYKEECELKKNRVDDTIKRIGGIDAPVNPIISCTDTLRYRNKAQLPVGIDKNGRISIGFYAFHSHRIIVCDDCLLQPESFSTVIKITRDFIVRTGALPYDEATGKGKLRHIYIRRAEITGELMVCYVVNGGGLKQEALLIDMLKENLPELKTVIFNTNREKTNVILGKKNRIAFGDGYITDELCGLKFRISPFSFWQVNRTQAELLYKKAREYAAPSRSDVLLDLYCGTGTIGLTMARDCKTLVGVEIVSDAIEDAKKNADLNGIDNSRFICADASTAAVQLKSEGLSPDIVILDPPRKGCGEQLVNTVAQMNPKRIVYVSCDPATLARDLSYFSARNYKTTEITPVDMFPRTGHVETVVLMQRKG